MIRDHARRQRSQAAQEDLSGPVHLDALSESLADAALVEFVHLDGLHAVTLVDGRARLQHLGAATDLGALVDQASFALHRLAASRPVAASQAAATAMLRRVAARLDDILLRPLAARLGERPLVVVPTGPLQSLPWSVLPSCAGRPVVVAPSATLWDAASRRPSPAGHVVVAADPDLPGARAEAEAIAAIYDGSTALLDTAATVEAVTSALNRASLAHLAAHGHLRSDNPLFSSLRLADGPLTLYDVERLEQVPRTVVLAACDSAQSVVRPGDELLGFSATFLARDTRQLIASVVPLPDVSTAPVMIAFHRLLAAGQPAATALALAQQRTSQEATAAMAAAAGFVCIGAGLSTS
jgi:CHAT domain-containing protein